MPTAEERARETIDRLLGAAGWAVQDYKQADIHAARGVALPAVPRCLDAFDRPFLHLAVAGKAMAVGRAIGIYLCSTALRAFARSSQWMHSALLRFF